MRHLLALALLIACTIPADADETSEAIVGPFREVCMASGDPVVAAEMAAAREGWRKMEGSGQPRQFAANNSAPSNSFAVHAWLVRQVSDPAVTIGVSILEAHSGRKCSVGVEGLSGSAMENELVVALAMGPPKHRFPRNGETHLYWGDRQAGTEVLLRIDTSPNGRYFHLTSIVPQR